MSSVLLTQQEARRLVGEIFIYHMPFNQALGLELDRLDADCAEISFANKTMLVGNAAQQILHGGVTAAVLDVAAGMVCVSHALTRDESISEEVLRQRLSRMERLICGLTICVLVGASVLLPPAVCCAPGIKSLSRELNYIINRAITWRPPRQLI